MKTLKKVLMVTAGTGTGLFIASLIIYYYNLDMRLMAVAYRLLEPWYDHIQRRPLEVPEPQWERRQTT